jgi:hypothetical protein
MINEAPRQAPFCPTIGAALRDHAAWHTRTSLRAARPIFRSGEIAAKVD